MSTDNAPFSLSQRITSLYPPADSDYARNVIEVGPLNGARVEPATVVAVVKAAAEIVAAFGKMSAEKKKQKLLAEILAKIEELKQEILAIKQILSDVRKDLEALSAKVDAINVDATLQHLSSIQQTVLQQYKFWASTKDPVFLANAENHRLMISNDINALIADSYAHAYDVAFAFCHYLNLSFLLGVEKEFLIEGASSVLAYLRKAIDPGVSNSIGYSNALSGEVVRQLLDWQEGLVRDSFLVTDRGIWRDDDAGQGEICLYDYHLVYVGNLGTMVVIADPRNERSCKPFKPPLDIRALSGKGAVFFGLSKNPQFEHIMAEVADKNATYFKWEGIRTKTQAFIDGIALIIKEVEDRLPIQLGAED